MVWTLSKRANGKKPELEILTELKYIYLVFHNGVRARCFESL